jgi:four helix bundle protein
MPTFTRFEDMEAWRQARVLCREIYRVSGKGSFAKDFGLRDQIRRASVSIMSNIAEGFERSGTGEFIQFLAIAKGSAGEIRSQLYIALDQGYLDREEFARLSISASDTAKIIAGLMGYLRKSGVKGTKYKSSQT